MNSPPQTTRRRALAGIATAVATPAALSGCLGQDGEPEETTTGDGEAPGSEPTETTTAEPTTDGETTETTTSPDAEADFRLGGKTAGWVGQAPESIADQTNPTLQLTAGTTYTLVWENLDGVTHNFVILDADGNELAKTEDATEEGATRRLTFEATAEMTEYYCVYHPTSMRGDTTVGEETTNTSTTTSDGAY